MANTEGADESVFQHGTMWCPIHKCPTSDCLAIESRDLRARAARLEGALEDVKRSLLAIKHLPTLSVRDSQRLAHDGIARIDAALASPARRVPKGA